MQKILNFLWQECNKLTGPSRTSFMKMIVKLDQKFNKPIDFSKWGVVDGEHRLDVGLFRLRHDHGVWHLSYYSGDVLVYSGRITGPENQAELDLFVEVLCRK